MNGAFMPLDEAVIPIEDRGFQFADGVYEVVATYNGRIFAMELHLKRLQRSLDELYIDFDVQVEGIAAIIEEAMQRAGFVESHIYIQITRGVAPRHHEFPNDKPTPTVVITVKELHRPELRLRQQGVKAITAPDLRWKRCDIKSIALLPNILAKQTAYEHGAYEALLVNDAGQVTEGSSTSSFRVSGGTIYTSPEGPHILPSITRGILIDLIGDLGIPMREEFSSLEDYIAADEVFLAGTTTEAMPVVDIDGQTIGEGRPGPATRRIRDAFVLNYIQKYEQNSG
ncbi:MAG: D-amino acid aminotransferase [Candidatus Latescibacterota bacterium]|nr:D-amino acid aminotransferase [Candidatus Latescibacterota bacterium]